MKLAQRIAWNMFAGASGKIIIAALGLVILGILTRTLGPTEYGYYRTVLTFLALVGMFVNFGTHTLALREISRDEQKQKKVIGNAITFRLVLTTLSLLIGAAFAPLMGFDDLVIKGILVALYGYTAFLVNEVIIAVFYNKLKQHLASAAEVIGTAFTCALVVLFASLGKGLLEMLAALAAGQILTALISWIFANRSIPLRPHFDWLYWGYLIRAGWPIGASAIIFLIILRGDTMLLALYKPAADVGYYGVGAKIFEILTSVAALFANLMMPLFVQSISTPEKFRFYANASLNAILIVAVFVFAMLYQFGEEIALIVAGNQYGQTGIVIRILAPAVIIEFVNTLFRFTLTAVGQQRTMFKADIFSLVIAIPAYLIMIPLWSYEGAAWARVVTYSAVLLVAGTAMLRGGKIDFIFRDLLKIALAAAATLWAFTELSHFDLHWIVSIVIGGILYLALILIFGVVSIKNNLLTMRKQSKQEKGA